ncbi:MAG: beta-ketoacyl-ACP reductase [Candidatus Puniceispirillum sp.]|nr:beta-ketoacyl-ACP reductase [Candidatus Puniceispirillum sp.]
MQPKRIALVTGGTRGIGEAISVALKNADYEVAATYHGNESAAHGFERQHRIKTYKWDVSSTQACRDGVDRIASELGPIDILVNNAGITRDSMFHKMSEDQWHQVIETNLTSVFNMTHAVMASMRERSFGRIVSISSINGQKGQVGQANYCAAKAGLLGFTKALALEGASRGITANTIAPGYIETDMVRQVPAEILQKIVAQIPVGRLGTPQDIARAVLFLVRDEAGFITGSTITINGGQYLL